MTDDTRDAKALIQAQLQVFLDAVPEEQAQLIKEAASKISGAPADQITLQQAIEYLGQEGHNPEVDEWAEEEAEKFFLIIHFAFPFCLRSLYRRHKKLF